MMDGMELIQELNAELDAAEQCVNDMQPLGRARSIAERDYRIALSKAEMGYRANGYPVSIIGDVTRGLPDIAELRCARDMAEVEFEANKAAHYLHRQRADMYEAMIKVEWRNA